MIVTLSAVSILYALASVKVVRATDFTASPTFDLTTSSNIAGATNATYEFYGEDPNPSVAISNFTVVIPAGYAVNPTYLTTTPGILVMNGSGGTIGSPPAGNGGNATTTTTSGSFAVWVKGHNVGTATLLAPTPMDNGSLTFVFPASITNFTEGGYVDLITVPGLLVNPTSPGVYTWSAEAYPGGPPPNDAVTEVARSGYSQSITIVASSVPEFSNATLVSVLAAMAVLTVVLLALRVKGPKRRVQL